MGLGMDCAYRYPLYGVALEPFVYSCFVDVKRCDLARKRFAWLDGLYVNPWVRCIAGSNSSKVHQPSRFAHTADYGKHQGSVRDSNQKLSCIQCLRPRLMRGNPRLRRFN